jgi:hypothetical protein
MQIVEMLTVNEKVNEKVNERIKKQIECELRKNDVFKITNILENIKHGVQFAVVETADKRAVEVPFFYFWNSKIRIDIHLESTFKVVDFKSKNDIDYPIIIVL